MSISIKEKIVQADVLVIGGGIGGMQASIAASEAGAKVIVAEKSNTRRSGSGATGNDHFMCYIPEYHGDDFDEILNEACETLVGPHQDKNVFGMMMRRSFEVIQKWESYGIEMRPTGTWNFEGHSMPERRRYHLKYNGQNQKLCLTQKALSNGVIIMNHTIVTEILTKDNKVAGAIGLNISKDVPEMVIFQAKAIIISTGNSVRMYPGVNPAFPCNDAYCPTNAAGAAIAYRAGARLVNLDIPYVHAGPRLFARCGKATWIGTLTDYYGKPVGPFITKPSRELGDVTADIWQSVFDEKIANGQGPVFMNCSETSEEDLEHMKKSFIAEGDTCLNDYMEQFGIDLRKDMMEFGTYEYNLVGRGVDIDVTGSCTVPGLYACGDLTGNVRGDITSAAVYGQISGENAGKYALEQQDYLEVKDNALINEKLAFYNALMDRKSGAHWLETNSTLNQIMGTYVSVKNARSETLLKSALKYLSDLRRYAQEQAKAENSHELMRTLEVFDLIDLAEAVTLCAENRHESRGYHQRIDYPFTNPLLGNKFQTIEKTSAGVKLAFREKIRVAE